jgi:hypothetical protein
MNKNQWEDIFRNKPDSTVLESPNGTRITLGELKEYMRQRLTKEGKRMHKSGVQGISPAKPPKLPAGGRVQ